MIKLSRKNFYKNHFDEINKYVDSKKSVLHISSELNKEIYKNENFEKFFINPNEVINYNNFDFKTKKYDLIIVTDIFEVSSDIYSFVKILKESLKIDGKILLTSINPKWNKILKIFETINLKRDSYINSYIKPKNVSNIFNSLGFELIVNYDKQVFPFRFLGLGALLNSLFEILFGYLNLGIKTYFLLQLKDSVEKKYTKSIIVPAKNEEGNLEELISRIPIFNEKYQIIIICGPSKDNTYEKSLEIQQKYNEIDISVVKQSKNGKANAVWEAIKESKYETIAILDSDISVDPEELTNFFEIIENNNCDFVNGTRLMYPMEDKAMRSINKVGNRSFQFLISKIIGVNLSDTLCGTKVFKKSRLGTLYNWQNKMKVSDPFCDFDLIFSSAYSGAKILEYPVHYRSRKYGKTNISRFRDGWKLVLYLINSLILFKSSNY